MLGTDSLNGPGFLCGVMKRPNVNCGGGCTALCRDEKPLHSALYFFLI